MRIFQVTESLEIGGAERVVATLSNALCERHEVTVVCLKRQGDLARTLDSRIQLVCLEKGEGQDIRAWRRLLSLLRSKKPDVIHTHDWGVYLDVMLAAWLARVPVAVHTVHGHYMALGNSRLALLKRAVRHWLERWLVRCYGRVVCVSDPLCMHVSQEVGIPLSRLLTLPNGIHVEPLPPARSLTRSTVDLIAVGRLAEVKNFPLMLQAFAIAARSHDPLRLTIAGDGPQRQELEQLAQTLGVESKVTFLGFRADVDELLGQADALVLSSLSEGTPMSVLEAMRNALPVIATDVGGLRSLVTPGVSGWLVPSGDAQALAVAMGQLAGDLRSARAMGVSGHARALADFSIDSMVKVYLGLYGGSVDDGSAHA